MNNDIQNKYIDKMLSRTSVRQYLKKPLPNHIKEKLIDSINSSPTSCNASSFSAIIIDDLKILNDLASKTAFNDVGKSMLLDCSMCVIFCADLNRMEYAGNKNNTHPLIDHLELFNAAVGDAYIAATSLMYAAISYDLGTCFLGSIRIGLPYLKSALNLNENIVPIIGLVVGYPKVVNDIKPKINKVYYNSYNLDTVRQEIDNYDDIIKDYLEKRNSNTRISNWTQSICNIYTKKDILDSIVKNFDKWLKEK